MNLLPTWGKVRFLITAELKTFSANPNKEGKKVNGKVFINQIQQASAVRAWILKTLWMESVSFLFFFSAALRYSTLIKNFGLFKWDVLAFSPFRPCAHAVQIHVLNSCHSRNMYLFLYWKIWIDHFFTLCNYFLNASI